VQVDNWAFGQACVSYVNARTYCSKCVICDRFSCHGIRFPWQTFKLGALYGTSYKLYRKQ